MKQEWLKRAKTFLLKRDNLVICILTGVLLLIIVWPVSTESSETDSTEKKSSMYGLWDSNSSKIETASGHLGQITEQAEENNSLSELSVNEWSLMQGNLITESLEQRLEELLSAMQGVGKVKVMVTLAASGEKILEKDAPVSRNNIVENDSAGGSRSTSEMDTQETTVYLSSSTGEKIPYVVQEISPVIEGVSVVAQGGGDPAIQKNITETIQALFGIEVHKIKVAKMKQEE